MKKKEKKTSGRIKRHVDKLQLNMKKELEGEEIINIPNGLTILRIILSFVVVYLIFTDSDIRLTVSIFIFAALTDWFDGRLARWYHWETEFGRKTDMIADRFLWVGTALAIIFSFGVRDVLTPKIGFQLLMIMSREIISIPFALIAFFAGKEIPHARYVAKVTTVLQGFAMPAILLGVFYPMLNFLSFPLAIACLITGVPSGLYYIKDIQNQK